MIKKFLGFFLLVMMLSFGNVFAAENSSNVTDNAQLLKQSEIASLNQKIRKLEQDHKVRIGIAFLQTTNGKDASYVADNVLDKNFGNGQNGGILFLVAMDTREWFITTDEKMKTRITDYAGFPYISDKVVERLKSGDYYGACTVYVESIDELLTYYEKNNSAYDPSEGFNTTAAIMAVLLAILIGIFIRSALINSMSNIRPATEAGEYLRDNSVQLTKKRDTYLFTNVSRRPKPKSSSSHSGGGGSRGGHGGGGGHF